MHEEEQSLTGFDPIWQTERSDVPRLLTLHLLCVCYLYSLFRPPFCRPCHAKHISFWDIQEEAEGNQESWITHSFVRPIIKISRNR